MKNRILLLAVSIALALSSIAQNKFNLGQNPGNYGGQWTDQQLYDMFLSVGATSTRSFLPLQLYVKYGMATFTQRLIYPYVSKGMRSNVINIGAVNGLGTYAGQDTTMAAPGQRSWIPASINLPPFNADGSVNRNNLWAAYCYDQVIAFTISQGTYAFMYWEIWNEPDLTGNWQAASIPASGFAGSWQTNEPIAKDLPNLNTTIENYILLCKIANQVIKKYQPNAIICTGGLGYAWWYQWFLKKGGGQWVDDLSFHQYPYFSWTYCVVLPNGTCSTTGGAYRNSDMALQKFDSVLNPLQPYSFRSIETALGAPHLPAMNTESALPGWDYTKGQPFAANKTYGSGLVQMNYWVKVYTKSMCMPNFVYMSLYELGCTADSANITSGSEIASMGTMYNLTTASPGTQRINYTGMAMRAMYDIMHNYTSDVTQPALPAGGIDGDRWDSAGNKLYVLWAQTLLLDKSEASSGTYTLPAGVSFKRYDNFRNYMGIVSGTVPLSGTPNYFVQISGVVPPSPPVSNPGSPQTITLPQNSASLNGSLSTGATTYSWSQVTGPTASTISNATSPIATASNLVQGTYTYSLTVTNSAGSNAKQTSVTVSPSTTLPVANAGASQTITLPASSATLNGSASTNATTYLWSETNGPNTVTFATPNAAVTTVSGLIAGAYTFTLTCSNSAGHSTSPTTVTVNSAKVLTAGYTFISSKTVTLNYSDGSSVTIKNNASGSTVNYTQSTLQSGKFTFIIAFNDGTKNTYQ